MPLSEYSESVGGGLKLKGVKDGRVKKHKKKDRNVTSVVEKGSEATSPSDDKKIRQNNDRESSKHELSVASANKYGKTEAQLRHEERKRQLVSRVLHDEQIDSVLTTLLRPRSVPRRTA